MRASLVVVGLGLLACDVGGRVEPGAGATGGRGALEATPQVSGTGGNSGASPVGDFVGGAPVASGGARSGGAGARNQGGAGGSGNEGGIAEWTEPTKPDDSGACIAYKHSELEGSCNQAFEGVCEADLELYLSTLEGERASVEQAGRYPYYARSGCGLTEIRADFGFGSSVRVFDADGKLAGYSVRGDTPWGPCDSFSYERGQHLGACDDARECALAPDASETSELCLCACPTTPPDDGIASVDATCVPRPSGGWSCADKLDGWGDLTTLTVMSGQVRTGCGSVVVEVHELDDVTSCIYGQDHTLAGSMRRSASATGCPGVSGWRSGALYVPCSDERACRFGDSPPDPSLPACGKPPYR